MCDYVSKNRLKGAGGPKDTFHHWITKVHKIMRKEHIRFTCNLIGSGSRNMVIKNCNENGYFDLDFQIILTKYPNNLKPKTIKDLFRQAFNDSKPNDFNDMKDRSQSLRTKALNRGYGYDVIITRYDARGDFYILYNDKDSNSANNKDYSWKPRKEMYKYKGRLEIVKADSNMYSYLRNIYLQRRHEHKDDKEPNKLKSYQILNGAVVDTLKAFDVKDYPR